MKCNSPNTAPWTTYATIAAASFLVTTVAYKGKVFWQIEIAWHLSFAAWGLLFMKDRLKRKAGVISASIGFMTAYCLSISMDAESHNLWPIELITVGLANLALFIPYIFLYNKVTSRKL